MHHVAICVRYDVAGTSVVTSLTTAHATTRNTMAATRITWDVSVSKLNDKSLPPSSEVGVRLLHELTQAPIQTPFQPQFPVFVSTYEACSREFPAPSAINDRVRVRIAINDRSEHQSTSDFHRTEIYPFAVFPIP